MDSSRTQDRLFSFVISAMLTSAVLATAPSTGIITAAAGPQSPAIMSMIDGMRSAGFSALKDAPMPSSVASPSSTVAVKATASAQPGLTPAQVAKLRKLALGPEGNDGEIRASVAKALGLNNGDRAASLRSFSAEDSDTKILVQIYLLPNNAGYIIARSDGKTVRLFKLDAALNMTIAVSVPVNDNTVSPIPAPDAQKLCDADKATMGQIADALGVA
jgi:hypothetical protein